MIRCQFNGAKDAGDDRFDPRYDCDQGAVWHILLAQDARDLSINSNGEVFACAEHRANVENSTAMAHAVDRVVCGRPGARWRLTGNCCAIVPSWRRPT